MSDWKVGDYAEIEDFDFKVVAISGEFLMVDKVQAYKADACRKMDTSECGYCHEQTIRARQERYSFGVYAGKMCDECAYSRYRDHCGLEGSQGSAQDLDEDLEPEDYYGMGRDLADMGC